MSEEKTNSEDTIPFYPDHILTEARVSVVIILIILVIGGIGLLFPVGLGPPADPMNTPEHVKPEWYFLALYQVLKVIPKTIGALIPFIIVGVLIIWPFLDNKPDRSQKATKYRFRLVAIGMVILIALTILGEVT